MEIEKFVIEVPNGKMVDQEYFNSTNTIRFVDKNPTKIEFPSEWELKEGTIYFIDTFSAVENINISKKEFKEENLKNSLPTKTLAKQMLIFTQLITMRERYREIEKINNPNLGEVDWYDTNKEKQCVVLKNDRIFTDYFYESNRTFSFQLQETRDKFAKNFGDMILQCKNILG